MLVLANDMYKSPPVFAWVLPVFVRFQTNARRKLFLQRHCILLFFPRESSKSSKDDAEGGRWEGKGKCKGKPEGKGKDREQVQLPEPLIENLETEGPARNEVPAEVRVQSNTMFCYRSINGISPPPCFPLFGKKKRKALICFAIKNGGR